MSQAKPNSLEEVWTVGQRHEGQIPSVGPASDGQTTQVKVVTLPCQQLQHLHLVVNLHCPLKHTHKCATTSIVFLDYSEENVSEIGRILNI